MTKSGCSSGGPSANWFGQFHYQPPKLASSINHHTDVDIVNTMHSTYNKKTNQPSSLRAAHCFPSGPTPSSISTTNLPLAPERPQPKEKEKEKENFEPLSIVEEVSWNSDSCTVTSKTSHPLSGAQTELGMDSIVSKHLAGEYDYHMTYSLPSDPQNQVIFGCNLINTQQGSSSDDGDSMQPLSPTYSILASAIQGDGNLLPEKRGSHSAVYIMPDEVTTWHQEYQSKTPSRESSLVVEAVESLTSADWAGSYKASHGSSADQRIEDSFEKIDQLEDETEAIRAVIRTIQGSSPERKSNHSQRTAPSLRPVLEPTSHNRDPYQLVGVGEQYSKVSTAAKRMSIGLGQSATVRVKACNEPRQTLRRATSMTLRGKKAEQGPAPIPERKHTLLSAKPRSKAGPGVSITPLKVPMNKSEASGSLKKITTPTAQTFELPGEAVSRRLKEQRAAREARHAKAQVQGEPDATLKLKASKRLSRPTFELPGEAISRRKREELEAKLKAQEEEEQKRREFKARPLRHSMSCSNLVRKTAASQARQARPTEVTPHDRPRLADTFTRLAAGLPASPTSNRTPRLRISASLSQLNDDFNHKSGSPTGTSFSVHRSTVTAEDLAHQKARGRDIYVRDNSYTQSRERERRDREIAMKAARELAAERSRVASREWAERRALKESGVV